MSDVARAGLHVERRAIKQYDSKAVSGFHSRQLAVDCPYGVFGFGKNELLEVEQRIPRDDGGFKIKKKQ